MTSLIGVTNWHIYGTVKKRTSRKFRTHHHHLNQTRTGGIGMILTHLRPTGLLIRSRHQRPRRKIESEIRQSTWNQHKKN